MVIADQAGPIATERSSIARIAGNALPLFASYAASSALLLINLVLLARVLDLRNFGTFAVGLSVFGLVALVADFGLNLYGLRAIHAVGPWPLTATILKARLITVSVALACGTVIILAIPGDPEGRVAQLILLASLVPATLTAEWALTGLERTRGTAAVRMVNAVLIVLLCPLLATRFGALGASAGYVVAASAASALGWLIFLRLARPILRGGGSAVATIRSAAPLAAAGIMSQTYWNADTVVVASLSGALAAGLYAGATRPLAVIVAASWVVSSALVPVLVDLKSKNPTQQIQTAAFSVWLLALASLPLAVVLASQSSTAITALIGNQFGSAAPVLGIQLLRCAGWLVVVPVTAVLISDRNDRAYLGVNAVGAVFALPAMIVGFELGGIVGLAFGLLATQILQAFVGLRWSGLLVVLLESRRRWLLLVAWCALLVVAAARPLEWPALVVMSAVSVAPALFVFADAIGVARVWRHA